jgi:hypothetical protein
MSEFDILIVKYLQENLRLDISCNRNDISVELYLKNQLILESNSYHEYCSKPSDNYDY